MADQLAAYRREQQAKHAQQTLMNEIAEKAALQKVIANNPDLPISALLADGSPSPKRQKVDSKETSASSRSSGNTMSSVNTTSSSLQAGNVPDSGGIHTLGSMPTQTQRPHSFGQRLGQSSGLPSALMGLTEQSMGIPAAIVPQPPTALDIIRANLPSRNVVRLLTWNIDGLDGDHDDIVERLMNGVVEEIVKSGPTVVLLQEVIPPVLDLLRKIFRPIYNILAPSTPLMPYFSAILVLKNSVFSPADNVLGNVGSPSSATNGVQSSSSTGGDTKRGIWPKETSGAIKSDCGDLIDERYLKRVSFPQTQMGRELLTFSARYDDYDIYFSTAHLESQKIGTAERKRQLDTSLAALQNSIDRCDVGFFGGDLNLRDAEAEAALKKCSKTVVRDAWVVAGSDANKKFTWDLQRNDNISMGGGFIPRCRFDRLYTVAKRPDIARLKSFNLVGTARLEHGRFPSDHFGILTEWGLGNGVATANPNMATGSSRPAATSSTTIPTTLGSATSSTTVPTSSTGVAVNGWIRSTPVAPAPVPAAAASNDDDLFTAFLKSQGCIERNIDTSLPTQNPAQTISSKPSNTAPPSQPATQSSRSKSPRPGRNDVVAYNPTVLAFMKDHASQ